MTSRVPKPDPRSPARPVPPNPPDRAALADVGEELERTDPELAASLARLGVPRGGWLWLAVGGGPVALLVLGVLGGPAALGIAGVVLVVAVPLLVCLVLSDGGDPGGPES